MGLAPNEYRITLIKPDGATFAQNDADFTDPVEADHTMLGEGLKRAMYNYMHGMGFEFAVDEWFEADVAPTSVNESFIVRALR